MLKIRETSVVTMKFLTLLLMEIEIRYYSRREFIFFSHYPSKHGCGNIVTKILKFTVQKLFAIELDIRQILETEFRILTMSTATL